MAQASFNLTLLPVEIRVAIFEGALGGEWLGKVPNLLVALRGSGALYFQALDAFRKVNKAVLWEGERSSLESMMRNPLIGVKTLVIESVKCYINKTDI